MSLSILYRGPLSSCNYACAYCPFAMRRESRAALARDRAQLERFVDWVAGRTGNTTSVFFTPWGEALVRRCYRDAIVRLSRLPHVARVAAQTNLSCGLDWLEDCDRATVALWGTYHPSQVSRAKFVAKCRALDRMGVRYSVGVVGMKEHADEIAVLRSELDPGVYLWVNAYKREKDYYAEEHLRAFERIDPLFPINAVEHPSLGRDCRAGHTVVSIDGDGDVRRCHFVREKIGNIYETGWERALVARRCPNDTCGCHIGYVHMDDLKLYEVFGDGVLERVPKRAW